jgi:hypothetical protein
VEQRPPKGQRRLSRDDRRPRGEAGSFERTLSEVADEVIPTGTRPELPEGIAGV